MRQAGLIPVRNDSGFDRVRFDVLGIEGPAINPVDNADAFLDRVGVVHPEKFVLAAKP